MNRKAGLLVGAVGLPVVLVVAIPLMLTATEPPGDHLCQLPTAAAAGKFTGEQMTIARTAGQVAAARHLPARAELVILATGFQESGIRNLTGGDRDSVGWLQQRAGWGSVAQRMNPAYAAGKFFNALVRVPGWESLPVTVAAQRVQVSAYPDAYARWVPEAVSLLGQLGDVTPTDTCSTTAASGGGPVPAGFDHQGNPRTVAQATAYLQSLAGRGIPGYPVLAHCEGYMTRAYGNGGGYPTAISHWNAAGPRTMGSTTVPPRGALVFWHTSNPAGHVALSLGNGIIESTDFNGTSYQAGQLGIGPISAIDKWGPRLGWRAPNFRVGSGN